MHPNPTQQCHFVVVAWDSLPSKGQTDVLLVPNVRSMARRAGGIFKVPRAHRSFRRRFTYRARLGSEMSVKEKSSIVDTFIILLTARKNAMKEMFSCRTATF